MLSLVVRLVDPGVSAGRLCGELEVVRTGERHRFRDVTELVELLERIGIHESTTR
jgi:hypothetical protein